MEFDDLKDAFGSTGQEGQQPQPETTGAEAESAETQEERAGVTDLGDGRVALTREDFDELAKGYARQQEFIRGQQQLDLSRNELARRIDQFNEMVQSGQFTPRQAEAEEKKLEKQVDALQQGKIPPEILNVILPMQEQIVGMKLKEEISQLKADHPGLTEDKMEAVFQKAAKITKTTGYNIPLEEAYYLVYGKTIEGNLAAVQKDRSQGKAKNWQSPVSGGGTQRPVVRQNYVGKDARSQAAKILEDQFGKN